MKTCPNCGYILFEPEESNFLWCSRCGTISYKHSNLEEWCRQEIEREVEEAGGDMDDVDLDWFEITHPECYQARFSEKAEKIGKVG